MPQPISLINPRLTQPNSAATMPPLGRQTFPRNILPTIRMHRGTDPAHTASYAEAVQSLNFIVQYKNSKNSNFQRYYNKEKKQLAGHDFQTLFRTAFQPLILAHGFEILNIFFHFSGDVDVKLKAFPDWATVLFDTPSFFSYDFPTPDGLVHVEAPRSSKGRIPILKLEFRGCSSRIEPEDIAYFLENAPTVPLSLGQFVVRYKKVGPYWPKGDYIVYIKHAAYPPRPDSSPVQCENH